MSLIQEFWISALQFGAVPLRAIEHAFLIDQIAYCDQIADEIHKVVGELLWLDGEVDDVLSEYLSEATRVSVKEGLHRVCRDPKDDMVFECAIQSEAGVFVSGDRDLLDVERYQGVRVLTARECLDPRYGRRAQ